MENRKILIEVTEEEYEKIKGGALNKQEEKKEEPQPQEKPKVSLSDFSCKELIREINGRTPEQNVRTDVIRDGSLPEPRRVYEGTLTIWFDDGTDREYENVVTISIKETGKSRKVGDEQ